MLFLVFTFLFLLLLFLVIFLVFECYVVIIAHLKGAPFVPTEKKRLDLMLAYAKIKPGDKIVDLGSGSGKILIAAAKRGAYATGIEINPFLCIFSRWRAKREKLEDKIKVIWGDFWSYALRDADVVFLYLLPKTLERLLPKLEKELKPETRIISNAFPIPGWTPVQKEDGVFVYVYQGIKSVRS